jgi:SNF2 family DNA or RNA helicase
LEDLVPRNQKTIIYARFHQDLQILKETIETMGLKGVEFSGRISDKQCEVNKLAFQSNDPESPTIFYATTASGGESLNLQIANRTIYYSNSYNWGHRRQSERRTWRGGQKHPCQYWDVFGFPIDRMIRRNNIEKHDMAMQMRTAVAMLKLLEEV